MANRLVFCDFDGTITDRETLMALMMHLLPGETEAMGARMIAREVSVKEGVETLINRLPSSRYGEIIEFSRGISIRPGFDDFLDFLETAGVPFVLVSGGLGIMVRTVLGDRLNRFAGVFALELDASGPFLRVLTDFEGEQELMAKKKVMETFSFDESVIIGDGVTDRSMALSGDLVFARGNLSRFLNKRGKPHFGWKDFRDIRVRLAETWGGPPGREKERNRVPS